MAASVEDEKARPNIRIEISNDLKEDEKMDVDPESENEEGEIIETDDLDETPLDQVQDPPILKSAYSNIRDGFTIGMNIFDKEALEKLQERARRFSLKPEEIRNFTDADLKDLYESLGITLENESNIRFEAVHLLGINGMSVEDILEYFVKYAPAEVEWISVDSCNVTWVENISAARAMFYTSKPVNGMPAREQSNTFPKEFLDDNELEENTGKSILLKNREVELKIDDVLPSKTNFKDAIDISEIIVPIPPGYWRLGNDHPIAKKQILLRYAMKTDQKPYTIENLSKYHKKIGSRGIILESQKNALRGIFERNKELSQEKNPWGPLARNWDKDFQFREHDRQPPTEVKKNPNLVTRLGKKPDTENGDDVEIAEDGKSKSRIPRMRMYADDEEEKVRRKKLLQTLKKHTDRLLRPPDVSHTKDLRNMLRLNNRTPEDEVIVVSEDSDEYDFGKRLKDRIEPLVLTVRRDLSDDEYYRRKEDREDARSLLVQRRAHSPLHKRRSRRSPTPKTRYRSRSPITRYKSPVRRRSSFSGGGMRSADSRSLVHSSRMYSRHRTHHQRGRSHSADNEPNKPRSRVAIVVRKQKKPTVASTIWSRVKRSNSSSSSEEESEGSSEESEESSSTSSSSSSSEESESESESESEQEEDQPATTIKKEFKRPGFRGGSVIVPRKVNHRQDKRTPLKITMSNDRYKR